METIAINGVGSKQEEVHDVVVKQIGQKDFLAKAEQAILQIEPSLLRQIVVRVNHPFPFLLGKACVIARNCQVLLVHNLHDLSADRVAIYLILALHTVVHQTNLFLYLSR